jgi:hypothetical protein
MLTNLRDKIVCPSDLAVSGELSENPDQKITKRTMVSMKFCKGCPYNRSWRPIELFDAQAATLSG